MSLNAIAVFPLVASLVLAYRPDPGRVYVAADSRMTSNDPASAAPASACKIRVLNGSIVFVGTGNVLFSAGAARTDIYSLAEREAGSPGIGPATAEQVREIALRWQREVHARLLEKMKVPATGQSSASSVTGTTGSFYAAVAGGTVYALTLRVAPNALGMLQDIEEPPSPAGYLVATGTNEAKAIALTSASGPAVRALPWPRRLQAIEMQTIRSLARRYGHSDVGGPIDLIEINASGPSWLVRKSACR